MANRRSRRLVAYLLTFKQREYESLKAYLARFNKECMTANEEDEKITLAMMLGGVWRPFLGIVGQENQNHIMRVYEAS